MVNFTFLFLMYVGLMITISIIDYIVEKIFKVEHSSLFSENYVNERHKKIDWINRIVTAVIAISVYIFSYDMGINQSTEYLAPLSIYFFSNIINQLTSIYMEKKHLANTNQYKATIVKSILTNIVIFIFFYVVFNP